MRNTRVCSSSWKTSRIQQSRQKHRNANGYAMISALVCLFLVMQLCTLCSLQICAKARLLQASRQSVLDLSIYSQAADLAASNTYSRKCMPDQEVETIREVEIDGIDVLFEDQNSCIDIQYEKQGRNIHMKLFYTEDGLNGSQYIRN